MPEPAADVTMKDIELSVNHVLAVKNGTVLVTIQDGVILEVEEKAIKRRRKGK
jgi:hypothetical protein